MNYKYLVGFIMAIDLCLLVNLGFNLMYFGTGWGAGLGLLCGPAIVGLLIASVLSKIK